jgi:hypothetical protein
MKYPEELNGLSDDTIKMLVEYGLDTREKIIINHLKNPRNIKHSGVYNDGPFGYNAGAFREIQSWLGEFPANQLSVRAKKALGELGITTKEQAREAIKLGKFKTTGNQWNTTRNYGKKAHKELCDWAEFSLTDHKHYCPHCGRYNKQ